MSSHLERAIQIETKKAISRAMLKEGIDVFGESNRPGHKTILGESTKQPESGLQKRDVVEAIIIQIPESPKPKKIPTGTYYFQ